MSACWEVVVRSTAYGPSVLNRCPFVEGRSLSLAWLAVRSFARSPCHWLSLPLPPVTCGTGCSSLAFVACGSSTAQRLSVLCGLFVFLLSCSSTSLVSQLLCSPLPRDLPSAPPSRSSPTGLSARSRRPRSRLDAGDPLIITFCFGPPRPPPGGSLRSRIRRPRPHPRPHAHRHTKTYALSRRPHAHERSHTPGQPLGSRRERGRSRKSPGTREAMLPYTCSKVPGHGQRAYLTG